MELATDGCGDPFKQLTIILVTKLVYYNLCTNRIDTTCVSHEQRFNTELNSNPNHNMVSESSSCYNTYIYVLQVHK